MTTQLINKLSSKTIMGAKPELKDGKPTLLYTVIGIAVGYKNGESNFGEFTEFQGTFEAIRESDGEVFKAGKLFLPDVATNMLQVALSDENTKAVEIALQVGISPAETPTGYQYAVKPLVKESHDPLAGIREKIALPAPVDTTEEKPKAKTAKK